MADKKMTVRIVIYVVAAAAAALGVTVWKAGQQSAEEKRIAENEAKEAVIAAELLNTVNGNDKTEPCADGCKH